jgi:predicted PurR-regulated permease PerM
MNTSSHKLIEYIYFFVILVASGYLVWRLMAPVLPALALAAIVVTICYPMYERILVRMPRENKTLASLLSLGVVIIAVVIPMTVLSSLILKEALSIYSLFSGANPISIIEPIEKLEKVVQVLIPTFSVDMVAMVQQTAQFFVNHIVAFFAGTASTIFLFFIAVIAMYYFFKDGRYFTKYLISLSPLGDTHDTFILERLAQAVRSVALGTVSLALIQGILTALGLTLAGFDRAILWGCVAALGALVPGVGTTIVFIPAVAYLVVTGGYVTAVIVALWGVLAVGLIDNLLGPYLMSKGNNMHPMVILLSVLGGITLFGPIGFILGPVIMSLFLVLLELYSTRILEKKGLS